MSQRALKKREHYLLKQEKETHQIYRKQAQPSHKSKYTQRNSGVVSKSAGIRSNTQLYASKRKFSSTPNLSTLDAPNIVRSHSESDLSNMTEANAIVNAKSEFHLQSIASTQLNESNYLAAQKKVAARQDHKVNMQSKRLSIQSGASSQTASSMTSSTSEPTGGFVDLENIRVPIVGYEVMEERARFTVYKLRIENPFTNDCWLVLRRYTDFQRLNNKLKSMFPHMTPLTLPRKKLFGDNFSSLFLNNRVQGLQLFINAVMANETLKESKPVRDFFCLDEPPAYSESIEECRAIFEAQEETINHLKMQLRAKDDVIMTLQQQINNEIEKNCALSTAINFSYANCENCSKKFDELMDCRLTASSSK